jgi:hypothetical protein
MTAPPGFDEQYWAKFEQRMAELGERARPTEEELAGRLRRALQSLPREHLVAIREIIDRDPGLRHRLQHTMQFAPTRVRRVVRAAVRPLDRVCATCQHGYLQHREPGATPCCTIVDCLCSAFASVPADVGLPDNWPDAWPVPALVAAAEIREYEQWRTSTAKGAKLRARAREDREFEAGVRALINSVPKPVMTASARRQVAARKRSLAKAVRPGPTARALARIEVVGDDPADWRVTDNTGSRIDGVVVTASGKLARKPHPAAPFPSFELPVGDSRLDRLTAFSMGLMDRLSHVASEELAVEKGAQESGALEKLAAQVERLVNRPQPPITVKPPDVHVTLPEQPPVEIDYTKLPVPQVHVNVEQPRPRAVRVEVDPETGEKRYVVEELEPEVED